ncbi:hypothetical protein VTK56DRAFT_6063 [Thermocarpiscus australiensis]
MIHDCGIGKNCVVLPLTPIKVDVERMKRGGNTFAWDPNEDQWYGVVPSRGGAERGRYLVRADDAFHGHVAGCYELPSGEIVVDLTVADGNVFFFFPPDDSILRPTGSKKSAIRTKAADDADIWVADDRVKSAATWITNGELSRIDGRFVTKPYRHFWQAVVDPSKPYDIAKCGPPAGGLIKCLGTLYLV